MPVVPPQPAEDARASLRDALVSARRWRGLLSPDERQRLLLDIARVALAIGQDLYAERDVNDLDIGGRADNDPCPRERLAFLTGVWPRLAHALCRIEAAPHYDLVLRTRLVPPERARRVAPLAVLSAVRAGDLVSLPPANHVRGGLLAQRLGGRLPRRIAESFSDTTVDTPPNRAIKSCLGHFAHDLAAVSALAQIVEFFDVAREAERLRIRIRSHLTRAPWRNLPFAQTVPPLTPTLRARPHYRLVHDIYRRYRQSFRFDWDNPLFTLPARETWLLYEYWGFFQVADTLHSLGCRATHGDQFALTRSGLTFTLTKGTASRLDYVSPIGDPITLTYNREFARTSASPSPIIGGGGRGVGAGWHSRSHAMRPDITLERKGRLLLLDPKFKTYAEPGWEADDIHQMHAYRDAITHHNQPGVVEAAWLLYAGRVGGDNRPAIAFPRATPEHPHGRGEIGALLLRPGGDNRSLRQVIARFLGD